MGPPATLALAGRAIQLPAGSLPEGVAADPKTGLVAVALRRPDRLTLVNAHSLRVRRTVFVPGRARHLVLAKPGGPLLLPGEDTNELVQVSLPSGRVEAATAVGKQPHNASYAGGRIYVADELNANIDVIDAVTAKVIATLPGPVQPGGTAVGSGVLSAVDVRGARLYTWSQRTLRPLGTLTVGDGPTHEAEVGHGRLVVIDTRGNQLLLVDPVARRVIMRLAMPGVPYGIASDPTTGRVWVTLTATNQVVQVKVDGDRLEVVRRWSTVQQPNTLGYDPADRCLFVAGVTLAQLQRICLR